MLAARVRARTGQHAGRPLGTMGFRSVGSFFFPNDEIIRFFKFPAATQCGIPRRISTLCPLVARWWNAGGPLVARWWNAGGTLVARWWNDVARIDITKNGPYREMVMSVFDALSAD